MNDYRRRENNSILITFNLAQVSGAQRGWQFVHVEYDEDQSLKKQKLNSRVSRDSFKNTSHFHF